MPSNLTFRFLFLIGLSVATTSGCEGTTKPGVRFGEGLPKAPPATASVQQLERTMVVRVNRDRAQNQLPPLKLDPRLSDIARSHSFDMRDNHFFEHESPRFGVLSERLHRAGYAFLVGRENLAENRTVEGAEEGLLLSPHHYENLMASDITHIGIGIVEGGVLDPKNLTITQIFATPAKQESLDSARTTLVDLIAKTRQKASLPAVLRDQTLDSLAKEELGAHPSKLDASTLKQIGQRVVERVAKAPLPGTSSVAVLAQVIVDSSQFTVDGAMLSPKVKRFGLAVDRRDDPESNGTAAPKLRVLIIVAMP